MTYRAPRSALVLATLLLCACGDDGGTGGAGGSGGATGGGGAGASGGGSTGGGGVGGSGGGSLPDFVPTPADVQFEAVDALPPGEQILVNDWNAVPNELLAVTPDGATTTVLFRSYRVWAFGAARDRSTIAFAAGDPEQEAHYGITVGDAIQPTFLYDVATETAENLTHGSLNDECHTFSADADTLYLCRRYDFAQTEEGLTFSGYRIGKVDLATKAFTWITAEDPSLFTLSPQPTEDESELIFAKVPVPSGTRTVVRMPLPSGAEDLVRQNAGSPALSPDGSRVLVSDPSGNGAILSIDLATQAETVVVQGAGLSSFVWSPSGTDVAFLRWDGGAACSHVEIAAADGSQAMEAKRLIDCAAEGRFVSELAWVGP